ncbi:CAAX prenyl protease [Coemansia sp. RSA 2399]|nr:CAAX prenyl protease [Coemansia sp. RSA 2399]KAJ1904742.1 CAAX prenyl protease [Coemansia sp. IMI 209127]
MNWSVVQQPPPSVWAAVGLSVFHVSMFVGLIYVFMVVSRVPDVSIHNRNHPQIIARRILGVSTSAAASLLITAMTLHGWQQQQQQQQDPAEEEGDRGWLAVGRQMGLAPQRACGSLVVGLVLTVVLYTGPLVLDYLDGSFTWAAVSRFVSELRTLRTKQRDCIVGPLTEELVFRASIVPLWLASGVSPVMCIFVSPVLFGLAHLHQGYRLLSDGASLAQAAASTAVQLTYTTLFGWFAVAVFIRSHSVVAPVAAHVICNIQGLPDLGRINEYQGLGRYAIWAAFVLGLFGFVLLFEPMTRPGVFV